MEAEKALYLMPVSISEAPINCVLPSANIELLKQMRYFIVENVRTARRFIKQCWKEAPIGEMTFYELNRHTAEEEISSFLNPLREGYPMALMSEAGCPGVADPGAKAVEIAWKDKLRVIPLIGPSSILLSLMASGFNGQSFAFQGYLPIDPKERERKLRELEEISRKNDTTQIFIETPYRNNKILESMMKVLKPSTRLCVAADITDPEKELIRVASIAEWKKIKIEIDKRPTIFLIYGR